MPTRIRDLLVPSNPPREIETPGGVSKAHKDWIARNLPGDLRGPSVLDVGAWDGYFSFLAERRGASRLLAVERFQNVEKHSSRPVGFEPAKEVLGSRVEYRVTRTPRVRFALGDVWRGLLLQGVCVVPYAQSD